MKIIEIECYVLLAPDMSTGSTSSAQDSFIVILRTDEGIEGLGESDVNPWIARACVEAPGTHTMGRGIREMLIGADPLSIGALWERLYVGTAMNGRRGAVIHAIGAIEMALWNIRGKLKVSQSTNCWAVHNSRPWSHTRPCNRPGRAGRNIAIRSRFGRNARRRWASGR